MVRYHRPSKCDHMFRAFDDLGRSQPMARAWGMQKIAKYPAKTRMRRVYAKGTITPRKKRGKSILLRGSRASRMVRFRVVTRGLLIVSAVDRFPLELRFGVVMLLHVIAKL